MDKNNNSNNMLNNLLPLFMNQGKGGLGGLGGGNNNMLAMLLPMLMQKGGGGSSDMLKTLIPAMTGNNPQMAQMLKNMNFGGGKSGDNEPETKEYQNAEKPQYTPPCKNNNKGRHYADYSKLYPDINNMDLHKMPKIDDFKKDEQPVSESNENDSNPQPFGNNSLITLLTLMQNMRNQPNSTAEERIQAVDGIAPPKIKKSLKAILALNNIIKE